MPRRLRHRTDGLDRRALLRPADRGGRGDGCGAAPRPQGGPAREAPRGPARRGRPQGQRRPPGLAAPAEQEVEGGRLMAAQETRVLFRNLDEPGLRSIETYRKLGGYQSIRKAYTEMTPEEVLKELEESGLR